MCLAQVNDISACAENIGQKETLAPNFVMFRDGEMKYYIASSLNNSEQVNLAAAALKKHNRTYDWTLHGDVRSQGSDRLSSVSVNELRAVEDADFVLVLLPGGKGTHTELGAALAHKRKVLLWSSSGEEFNCVGSCEHVCAFYFHPAAERLVCPFESLLERLRTL